MGCGMSRIHDDVHKSMTVLVLGPKSSGKSTLIKRAQMAFRPLDDNVRRTWAAPVRATLLETLREVCNVTQETAKLAPALLTPKHAAFLNSLNMDPGLNQEAATMVEVMFRNGAMQLFYEISRMEPYSGDTKFVRDAVQRACKPDFMPTDLDVLLCSWSTRGFHQTDVAVNSKSYIRFIDVGGSVEEQRKWAQAATLQFNEIIFVIPLDSVLKILADGTAQIDQDLGLLRRTLTQPGVRERSVFVFLTKRDRLESAATAEMLEAAQRVIAKEGEQMTTTKDVVAIVEKRIQKIYEECQVTYRGLCMFDCVAADSEPNDTIRHFVSEFLNKS